MYSEAKDSRDTFAKFVEHKFNGIEETKYGKINQIIKRFKG